MAGVGRPDVSPKAGGKAPPPRPAGADPWLALAPDIRFPEYPLVTEEAGPIAAMISIPFSCPFQLENGIICATTGYEAVAPCNAKVEDKWAVSPPPPPLLCCAC
jgi:hypothetical protein